MFKPPQSHCHSLLGRSGVHQKRLACKHTPGFALLAVDSHHAWPVRQHALPIGQWAVTMLCPSRSPCFAYQGKGRDPTLPDRQLAATLLCLRCNGRQACFAYQAICIAFQAICFAYQATGNHHAVPVRQLALHVHTNAACCNTSATNLCLTHLVVLLRGQGMGVGFEEGGH